MDTTYGAIIIVQVVIVLSALLFGGALYVKKAPAESIWYVAKVVVLTLPMALSWFGVLSAMFLEQLILIVPILVGVSAVGLNFILDALIFKKVWEMPSWLATPPPGGV